MKKILAFALCILFFTGCKKGEVEPNIEPTPQPEPSITEYKIGDLYDKDGVKGLVFRVYEDKLSGLIVSMTEPEKMKAWSSEFIATGCTERECGELNTSIIYSLPNWQSNYPAFEWCKSLGKGWYIPSIDELRELLIISSGNTFAHAIYNNKATPFATDYYYLSSTEMDEWWVYLVDAKTQKQSANYKQYTYHVRAIHTF